MTLHPRITARAIVWRADLKAQARAAVRTWQRVQPWLAAAAFVLTYLVVNQWIAAMDLRDTLRETNAANVELDADNQRLKDELAELTASRTRKLFYIIEGGSTQEAKDKLSRLALMLAAEHYQMDQEGRR